VTTATLLARVDRLRAEPKEFFDDVRARLARGERAVTLYGQPDDDPARLALTAVLEDGGRLVARRTSIPREKGFHALTRTFPALHVFER
jgi:hypothetical protein